MTTSNKSLTLQDIPVESLEEKGSFDAEFSLLESTLIELKDESVSESKNDDGDVAKDVVDLLNNTISINNYNAVNCDSVNYEIYNRGSKKDTDFGNCSESCKKSELISQLCESVNVPVTASDVSVSSCTLVVSQHGTSNLDCSVSKIKDSNNDLNKDSELQSCKPFTSNDNNLKSDIVISICDSSVGQNKYNQLASFEHNTIVEMNTETIVSDLENKIEKYDNSVDTCMTTTSNIKSEVSEQSSHESFPIPSPSGPQTSDNAVDIKELNIKHERNILESNTSSSTQNLPTCDSNGNMSEDIKLSLNTINPCKSVSEDGKDLPSPKAEIMHATLLNIDIGDEKNNEDNLSTTCGKVNYSSHNISIPENICNLKNDNEEITKVPESDATLEKCQENPNIYCSTPVASNCFVTENKHLNNTNNFEQMSPLNVICKKDRKDLKRKFKGLQCIDEVDEDSSDIYEEKKFKYSEKEDRNENEENISSTVCFETPAKSILKKWQNNNISRGSGSTFYILDECGENEGEEQDIAANHASSSAPADDFEIACKSLNEELMKEGTFSIEELENYYSKVQMENKIDSENFDEVLHELSLNYGINYEAPQSHFTAEKKSLTAESDGASSSDKTVEVCENVEFSSELERNKSIAAVKCESGANDFKEKNIKSIDSNENDPKLIIKVKENESENINLEDVPNSSTTIEPEESFSGRKNMTIIYADGEDLAIDEEDVLLEEDTSTKKKPYEFHEYVSSDPKENEDNYNPEWQKLGRLTTDEERYKAVRDRWRSLVPPDPNRDLTCRQWRKKNQQSPLNYPSRNNNHQMHSSNERNQLCTAVFEMKIKRIIDDLDQQRREILHNRNRDFDGLSAAQDREYSLMPMRGASRMEMAMLGKQFIEEWKGLKNRYDMELDKISRITEEKIKILKDASEEVLLFQKFYKGFGAGDDKVCLYMTDIQVQELMETEDMLEQYTKFYK